MSRTLRVPGRTGALVLTGAVLAGFLTAPSRADAVDLFPVDDIVGDVIGGAADFAGDQVAGAAVAALLGLIKFLVGDLDEDLGRQLVHFLLGLPDYSNRAHRALNAYAAYVTAIAWGLLGLVFVGSALRYWAAGFGGTSAYDALQAFVRCAAASGALLALKPGWHFATVAVNKLTWALAAGPGLGDRADELFVGALTAGLASGEPTPFGGLVLIGSLVAALLLLVTKVVLAATLAVLYLAAPLAIAVAPLEDLAWMARAAVQATVAVLAWPVVWALCFAVFALINLDAVTAQNPGDNGALGRIVQPLIGLAALVVAFKLPRALLGQALAHSSVPGFRTGRTLVVRAIGGGGQRGAPSTVARAAAPTARAGLAGGRS